MARQVFFDPFGQRVEGMRQGIDDEQSLQDTTRRARAADQDFNVNAPLRSALLQDAATLSRTSLPFQQRGLQLSEGANQIALADARDQFFSRIGGATGDRSAQITNAIAATRPGFGTSDPNVTALATDVNRQFDQFPESTIQDLQSYAEFIAPRYGVAPEVLMNLPEFQQLLVQPFGESGNRALPGFTSEAFDDFAFLDRTRQDAIDAEARGNNAFNRELQTSQLGVNQQNAQTQALLAQLRALGLDTSALDAQVGQGQFGVTPGRYFP